MLEAELPDGAGGALARVLRAQWPAVGLVFVSRLDRECDLLAGFAAGADDYIVKPFHPAVLVARVRALARRVDAAGADPDPLHGCGLELDAERKTAYLDGTDLRCTPIEYAILQTMAAVPGQALPHVFINQRVWSYSNLPDGTLLKGHISALRRKLRRVRGSESMLCTGTVSRVGYALAVGSGG